MNEHDAEFEACLHKIVPTRLDGQLLDRLCETIDRTSQTAAPDPAWESALGNIRPARLNDDMAERLANLIPQPESNVVAMPQPRRIIRLPGIAAAAAIAMIGALAALLAPIGSHDPSQAQATPARPAAAPQQAAAPFDSHFVPAAYARGFSEAHDHGMIWRDHRPHRMLRIVYMDTITLKNAAGEIVEVEQPRVEYILLPQKID
jgi:pyruvate/2-oxoglutarate dehydrogenase complex dihydrolipoamide acyltransferase (E2) component